jgi:ABC-2 type transport system permease protein
MITAGNRRRFSTAIVVLVLVAIGLHLLAWAIVGQHGEGGIHPTIDELVTVSIVLVIYCSLLLSQSLEQVTRTLYTRGDLDLVMSSPVPPRKLFAVRIVSNVALMAMMALVLAAPFINVLMLSGGPRWLTAYAVAIAVAVVTGSLSVAITIGLFRLLGPRRTRLVAQVVAAVVGAAFAIGIQVFAIIHYGQPMQAGALLTTEFIAAFPGEESLFWLPARGMLGDIGATVVTVALALLLLAVVVAAFAPRLGEHSIAATDLSAGHAPQRQPRPFTVRSPRWAMRRKEWLLLRRDPWLVSHTLTQLLYLIPPALLLAHNYSGSTGPLNIVVMVLVTVGGQLGGALGWLAISGEDAPDLVATAPVRPGAIVWGKVEAVIGTIALALGPLVLAFAFLSPRHAAYAGAGVLCAAASTLQIQLWFRAQARRTQFRRRHTSSRIATLAEALVSFSWAAAFGLAAAESSLSWVSVAIALVIMAGARAISPRKAAA